MAIERKDEVLGKAIATDIAPIPRYDLVLPDGSVAIANAALNLKNPILQVAMPYNKGAANEMLAASGVATGTSTLLALNQPGFTLFDGALIRFRVPVDLAYGVQINVTGSGARALVDSAGKPIRNVRAGAWISAAYSTATNFFVVQGSGGGTTRYQSALFETIMGISLAHVWRNR